MAHIISNIGPIVFVRWKDEILVADILAVEAEVRKQRARAGESLTILWIVSPDVKLMSNEARLALGRAVHMLKHALKQVHVVVEGTGFLTTTYRSIFTPSRGTSAPGPPVALHESVEACLDHVAKAYGVEVGALLKTARFQGGIS
jgi:hypothetical protein